MFAYTQMPQAMNASHNVANQMKSLNGVNIDYDANGSRTVDSRLRYTWNARNQLASYNSADGSQTGQFLYDAFGVLKAQQGFLNDLSNGICKSDGDAIDQQYNDAVKQLSKDGGKLGAEIGNNLYSRVPSALSKSMKQ